MGSGGSSVSAFCIRRIDKAENFPVVLASRMITRCQSRRHRPRAAVLGALLAWCIVWIGALHYAPTAHAEIHDDAHEADHHCVVEVFSEGVILDHATIGIDAPSTPLRTEASRAEVIFVESPAQLRPPGRAPPIG